MAIEQVGRYQIKQELGRGGMATVYLAHDPRFARDVAIKILPAQFTHDPQFKGRFEREARTIAALEHNAIVPVYDYGEENDLPYIVMRYMAGGSLSDRLAKGPLSLSVVQHIFSRLAPALDMAHKQGITHRDLKPGNILFDANDEPYLSDFGIAKISESTSTFTGSGLIGTPAYMSPEQARGESDIDHRSDIYSLGVILYQLLSGKMPFDADTPMGIVMRHIMDPVPEIRAERAELPDGVQTVIQTAMAKDRMARYQSAAALAKALATIKSQGVDSGDAPTELLGSAAEMTEPATELEIAEETDFATELDLPTPTDEAAATELDLPQRTAPDTRSDRPPAPPAKAPQPKAEKGKPKPVRPAWLPWAGGVGILLVVIIGSYLATRQNSTAGEGENGRAATQSATTNDPGDEFICTDDIGCLEVAAGEPIHLGYILTLSGGTETLGRDSLGGIELALVKRGQVLGHDILLTGEDSLCNAAGGGAAAAALLADPSLAAIIGTSCSSEAIAALPAISAAGLTMCSPSNTLPALTNPGQSWKPGYFRTATNDQIQGRVVAEFAFNELGLRTAGTINDDSAYSLALTQIFTQHFEALGGQIVFQGEIESGQKNFGALLSLANSAAPDLLYFPVFEPEGALLISLAASEPSLRNATLISSDGLLSETLAENAGQNVEGLYISGMYFWTPGYEEFLADWEQHFGSAPPSFYHAHAFDCTNLLLNAIETAAKVDPDGNLLIGRQAIRDAMTAVQDFSGITGFLNCTTFGDCATGENIAIYYMSSAERQGKWPPEQVYISPPLEIESAYRACLVTDTGGIDDNSFNSTVWAGLEAAIADFGINGDYLESEVASDFPVHLATFVRQGCHLIISVGFLLGEATYAAADENPGIHFTIVDYSCCLDDRERANLAGQIYRVDQAAFLAGYAAAATSQSGIVGTFGGLDIVPVTDFMDGFALGVQFYNQEKGANVQVIGWEPDSQQGLFLGNFSDTSAAYRRAEALMDSGADVLLPVAGPAGFGAAEAALDCGCAQVIGVDSDWKALVPEYGSVILTSIIKRMNVSIYDVIAAALAGDFPGGSDYVGTLENGGVGIFMDEFDSRLTQELNDLMRLIINGQITTQP